MATVLVADDSKVQLHLLATWLREAGYNVIAAMDCMQAWSAAVRNPPDAVVLDLNMPGGSGVDVLKKIKSSLRTAHIPVLVVTANDSELEPLLKSIGAAEYLKKPVDFEQLAIVMKKLIPSPGTH
jgi:DNA-binding response OmpR family regulator